MRTYTQFLVFLIAVFLLRESAYPQWVEVPIDYGGLIPKVFFVNHLVGWVVGGNFGVEFISKSTDGGATWYEQSTGRAGTLRDCYFADTLRGWAVGDSLRIVRTTDGGITWTDQRFSVFWYDSFNSVAFADSLHGWAAGSGESDTLTGAYRSALFHTTDAGATWLSQDFPASGWIDCIKFASRDSGWAVGWIENSGTFTAFVARTSNGGTSWRVDSTTDLTPS